MSESIETVEALVARDRERLTKLREEIFTKQEELQQELDAINQQFAAIKAYEDVLHGKTLSSTGTVTRRAPRGSRRGPILSLLKNNADGLKRGEIIQELGAKGDKAAEASITNALAALKKAGDIKRIDGKYSLC